MAAGLVSVFVAAPLSFAFSSVLHWADGQSGRRRPSFLVVQAVRPTRL